jgi:hypothetical protein
MNDFAGKGLTAYAQVCGELLARGHARSGDALSIAGYVGAGDGFAEALAEFGARYADRTEKDWEELKRSGKGRPAKAKEMGSDESKPEKSKPKKPGPKSGQKKTGKK